MKEFEKWWKENSYLYKPFEKSIFQQGYKAALEWILCITIDIEQNVKYIIKEELNE